MKPVLDVKTAGEFLKVTYPVTYPSAQKAISSFEEAGILTEITGRKRDKAYAASEILEALDGEMAP
jgi:cell filamentation protein, protein adenylyltransferase